MKKLFYLLFFLPLSLLAVGTVSGSITDANGDDLNGVAMVLFEDLFQEDTDSPLYPLETLQSMCKTVSIKIAQKI